MNKLNDWHVDILKIDIEGFEYNIFFDLNDKIKWNWVGQIYIELHIDINKHQPGSKKLKQQIQQQNLTKVQILGKFINYFENNSFRLFHREVNLEFGPNCCAEFVFIQKNWNEIDKTFVK